MNAPFAPAPLSLATFAHEAVRRRVLDVRDDARFAAGHFAGAGHVPFDAFVERRAELPAREVPVVVVADDPDAARRAAEDLAERGFRDVAWLDAPLDSLPGGLESRSAATRLWSPAPFLERCIERLPRGRALDLAAGSGREAVFLALHGFQVEAWDRAGEALARAAALAARHGVRVETVERDLEAGDATLPEARYDVVACFRYLHRPLFPAIARALRPGGALVFETFLVGQSRFGPPHRPRFLLEPGELASAFPTLDVAHYAECEPAGGPVTAQLLAFRPSSDGVRITRA